MTTQPEILVYLNGKFFDRISSNGNIPYVIADHSGHFHYLQKAESQNCRIIGATVNAYYVNEDVV